jgi:dethiobiotin synthetase
MIPGVFITGTDTGVGKTAVAAAILHLLADAEIRAVGLKPVASGSDVLGPDGELRNTDALELQEAAPVRLAYRTVNPFCYRPAIAPHIAAAEADRPIALPALIEWYQRATEFAEFAVVEGAGGWRVPLHPEGFLSDLPEALGLGVILVVGTRLGCLNHARLTLEAIHVSGRCRFLGWIANDVDPAFERRAENLSTLERLLGAPPLAVTAWTDARSAHGHPVLDLGGAALLREALLAPLRT